MCPIEFNEHRDGVTESDKYLIESDDLLVNEQLDLKKRADRVKQIRLEKKRLQSGTEQTPAIKAELASLQVAEQTETIQTQAEVKQIKARQQQEQQHINEFDENYGKQADAKRDAIDGAIGAALVLEQQSADQTPEQQQQLRQRQQVVINQLTEYILEHNPKVQGDPAEARRLAEIIFYEKIGYTDHERSLIALENIELQLQSGYTAEAMQNLLLVQQNTTIDPAKSLAEYQQERLQLRQNFTEFLQANPNFAIEHPAAAERFKQNIAKDEQVAYKKAQKREAILVEYALQNNQEALSSTAKQNLQQAAKTGGADIILAALQHNTLSEQNGRVTIKYSEDVRITIEDNGAMRIGNVTVASLEPHVFDSAYIETISDDMGDISNLPYAQELLTDVLAIHTDDTNRITGKQGQVLLALLEGLGLKKESSEAANTALKTLGIVRPNNEYDTERGRALRQYLLQTTRLDPLQLKTLNTSQAKLYIQSHTPS